MSFLLRLPDDLDAQIRESAAKHDVTITDWLRDAAEDKLRQDEVDIREFAEFLNGRYREVLDRLAE